VDLFFACPQEGTVWHDMTLPSNVRFNKRIMAMKVVGIYGSPRKGGNSDLILDSALEGAQQQGADIKRIYVRKLHISGCVECGGCESTGKCVIQDDMQDVYPLLSDADIIILSSPIFFYGLSSQLKALIDRAQALWSRKRLQESGIGRQKTRGRGYLLAVGATRGEKLFQGAQMVARYFFDALSASYEGGLFFQGLEGKGAVSQHPNALRKAYDLGLNVASADGTQS
jgi:multimeric flavodoxin WrbA